MQERTAPIRLRAESLYARGLESLAPGASVDVAALARDEPDLARELQRVHEDWSRVAGVHRALASGRSFSQRLRERFGSEIDRGLSLAGEPGVAGTRAESPADGTPAAGAPRETRYRLLGEVGRGGMGAIYRVWDPDLRRALAMKVVLGSERSDGSVGVEDSALSRFLEEAQVTGQLDHPGVVPVHELAMDADGRVFFTMRLVHGRDLEAIFALVHAEAEGWTLTRALHVILKVCEAMAYAHTKGVIHRDLKPANVMVGRFGEAYVMDWGLAKVLEAYAQDEESGDTGARQSTAWVQTDRNDSLRAGADPTKTLDGDILGTPVYMSPEQALGRLALMDRRSDVYALGAMLYHLLARHPPYAPPEHETSVVDIWLRLKEHPPEPLAERAPDAPSELVAIVEKAMSRKRAARYDDMLELAEDLQRFLEGRVVRAYESGALAELRKWVRRNKGVAVASAAALLAALSGLGTVSYVQAEAKGRVEATNVQLAAATAEAVAARGVAEDKAEELRRERDASERVNAFLVGLFESPDPRRARGETVTAKELLDRGAATIETYRGEDGLVWSRLMDGIGEAYHSLGLYADAEPLYERAWKDRRERVGREHPDTLESQNDLGRVYRAQARYDDAEPLLEEALAIERRTLGEAAPLTLRTRGELARLRFYQGRYDEAEALYRDLLETRERLHGPDDLDTLVALNELAQVYRKQARYGEARPLIEDVLARGRRVRGDDHPDTLRALNDLASVHLLERRYDEAERLYEQALEGRRRVLGPQHPDTLISLNDSAYLRMLQRRYGEAEPLYVEALEGYRASLGAEHSHTLAVLTNVAGLYKMQERYDEAEPLFVEAADVSRRVRGEQHPNTLAAQNGLASVYVAQGRIDEAEALFVLTLERHRSALGNDHPNTLALLQSLAELYRAQGRFADAEPHARELVERTPTASADRDARRALLDEIVAGRAADQGR